MTSVILASVVPARAETFTSPATVEARVICALPSSSVDTCGALSVAMPCSTFQSTAAPFRGWFWALTTFATNVTLSALFAVACTLSRFRLITCAVEASASKLSGSLCSELPPSTVAVTIAFATLRLVTVTDAMPFSSVTLCAADNPRAALSAVHDTVTPWYGRPSAVNASAVRVTASLPLAMM